MLAAYLKRNNLRIAVKHTMVSNVAATVAYVEYTEDLNARVFYQTSPTAKRSASFAIRGNSGMKAICGLIHRLATINRCLFVCGDEYRFNFDKLSEYNYLHEFVYYSDKHMKVQTDLAATGESFL